jgi:hypothetical protein
MAEASEPQADGDGGWLWALAGALVLTTPFVQFAVAHGYPLGRPELWIVLGGWAALGAAVGALLSRAGEVARVAGLALGLLFHLDVQTRWIDAWDLRLAAAAAGTLLGVALLRRRAARIAAVTFGALLTSSVLLPPGATERDSHEEKQAGAAATSPPPLWLHLLLDEQIGVEGIPREFDPDGARAAALANAYQDAGFEVFARAYSRYYDTHTSLANLLNFTGGLAPTLHFARPFRERDPLAESRYFAELVRRGHRLHVVQTSYIDLCHAADVALASCTTMEAESIAVLAGAPLAPAAKARAIQGVYLRLSFLVTELRRGWTALRRRIPALPEWETSEPRVSAVASVQLLDGLADRIVAAGPGAAFFVHLLLPHYPYAYDAACNLRPDPARWLLASDPAAAPRRNTDASRAERYPLYLDQMQCVHARVHALLARLDAAGVLANATVIVQGDHGSRIDRGPLHASNLATLEPADFIDGFSTWFAVRRPGGAAQVDRRVLPIDVLLGRTVLDGGVPDGVEWAPPPRVLLGADPSWSARVAPFVAHALPPFAHGAPE